MGAVRYLPPGFRDLIAADLAILGAEPAFPHLLPRGGERLLPELSFEILSEIDGIAHTGRVLS